MILIPYKIKTWPFPFPPIMFTSFKTMKTICDSTWLTEDNQIKADFL